MTTCEHRDTVLTLQIKFAGNLILEMCRECGEVWEFQGEAVVEKVETDHHGFKWAYRVRRA